MVRSALIAMCLLAPVKAQALDVYLHDVLKARPAYAKLYKRVLSRDHQLPAWLGNGRLTRQTIEVPGRDIKVGALSYFVANECWKEICEANKLFVAFDPNEQDAWGYLTDNGRPRWLGNPPAGVRQAVEALQPD